jgi:hypothetical protein
MQVVFVYMLTNAPPGLFKRLQALRTIINGLLRSLPAIGQALWVFLARSLIDLAAQYIKIFLAFFIHLRDNHLEM